MQKYKSPRLKFANYYENKLYVKRFQPMAMLQVGIENTIPVWNKYLERCNIYCIDIFDDKEPRSFKFLNEKKIFWSRCNVKEHKELEHVMKNVWNNPRFNLIIDNTNNYESLRKYGVGNYYKEANNEIFCHSCKR